MQYYLNSEFFYTCTIPHIQEAVDVLMIIFYSTVADGVLLWMVLVTGFYIFNGFIIDIVCIGVSS